MTIDLDMTPEEARKMMGLPDLEPLQTAIMEKMQQQAEEYFNDITDPEILLKKFMPTGIQAMEQYTQFFNNFSKASSQQSSNTAKQDTSQK